jgi:SEC-C motif-containing protein
VPKHCPCTSGRAYADCCGPFHRGAREAPTPEGLVRSRFAAFALGDAEYLWRTLHARHEDHVRPRDEVVRELREASRTYKYMRLTILEAKEARVLFLAAVFEKGRDRSFVELSELAHDGAGWRYVSGASCGARELGDAKGLTMDSFLR